MVLPPLKKGDDGSANRYPPRLCGMSYAGYGACVKAPGHDGFCEDAHRYLFTGKPERKPCDVCGLSHREVCPSGPGVAEILSAPTPEPVDYSLPACER